MRAMYLVCYDISNPRRLYQIRKLVRAFAVTGQKSFYECWFTNADLTHFCAAVNDVICDADSVYLFRLDPRLKVWCYGQAHRASFNPFMIV